MPSSWDLPSRGIEPTSLMSPVLAGRFFNMSTTWEALLHQKNEENKDLPNLLHKGVVTI